MSSARDQKEALMRAIVALEENEAWKQFAKRLGEDAKHTAEQHENEKLTGEQRAEWLHAMKRTRELSEWIPTLRAKTAKFLKETRAQT